MRAKKQRYCLTLRLKTHLPRKAAADSTEALCQALPHLKPPHLFIKNKIIMRIKPQLIKGTSKSAILTYLFQGFF